jgi:hypothetical protein
MNNCHSQSPLNVYVHKERLLGRLTDGNKRMRFRPAASENTEQMGILRRYMYIRKQNLTIVSTGGEGEAEYTCTSNSGIVRDIDRICHNGEHNPLQMLREHGFTRMYGNNVR